jgi:hypothetical protein
VESKPIRFAALLEQHIVHKVNKKLSVGKTAIDNKALHEISDLVRELVHGIFGKSSHKVTEPGLNWLSNQLFKNIELKTNEGNKPIEELVVFNEYKLADLPYGDIQLLRNLFNETHMGPELEAEYRRRSAA